MVIENPQQQIISLSLPKTDFEGLLVCQHLCLRKSPKTDCQFELVENGLRRSIGLPTFMFTKSPTTDCQFELVENGHRGSYRLPTF
jgi:hypothetical protein